MARDIGSLALACDVIDPTSAERAIAAARQAHGPARLRVNCAGGGAPRRVVNREGPMPLEEFTRALGLNLVAAFNMTRLAVADMMAAEPMGDGERGLVLFTASSAAFEGQIGQAAYTAAKGDLVALTIQLAREFAASGVRAMTIAPGHLQDGVVRLCHAAGAAGALRHGAVPAASGPGRGDCRTGTAHRAKPLPQWRGHPARRCRTLGCALKTVGPNMMTPTAEPRERPLCGSDIGSVCMSGSDTAPTSAGPCFTPTR